MLVKCFVKSKNYEVWDVIILVWTPKLMQHSITSESNGGKCNFWLVYRTITIYKFITLGNTPGITLRSFAGMKLSHSEKFKGRVTVSSLSFNCCERLGYFVCNSSREDYSSNWLQYLSKGFNKLFVLRKASVKALYQRKTWVWRVALLSRKEKIPS